MEAPVSPQHVKALLLAGAGLLFAGVVGWSIGSADYSSLVFGTMIVAAALVGLFSGSFFWVLTVASSFLTGTIPILRGAFTPFQILMAMGVVKFLIEDIVLRRARIKVGNRFDLLMIAGFMGILTLHGLHDRFGMRFLGSSVWGGRNYVNVYAGLAAFFVLQSIQVKPKTWEKLPYLVLAGAAFDLFIAILTTLFPASIYLIYPFYSAVSTAGLMEVLTGNLVDTSRLVAVGNFGFILITIVLASVSFRQLLHPSSLSRVLALLVGSLAVLFSSFRSEVVNVLSVTLLAGIRDLKWKVLALLPVLAVIPLGLSVVNSEFVTLPKLVQRSLTFMPGKWDSQMEWDAIASNDFRRQVWATWRQEFFPLRPWLGRGFGFRSEWAERSPYKPKAVDYRQTVEVGDVHNGLFASLDTFGVVGTFFFVIWNARVFTRIFLAAFHRNDPYGTVLRFVALYLGTSILCYWMGAANVGRFLPQEFALVGVFLRLQEAMASDAIRRGPADALVVERGVREELAST